MNVLLALTSGIVLPLALPNELFAWGLPALGMGALAPVLLVVYRAPTWRTAARYGALFGAVSTAIGNYWLAFFGDFSVWTIGGTVIGYTGYNFLLFAFLFHIVHGLDQRPIGEGGSGLVVRPTRAVAVAIMWAGYEYLKSVGFLGYPWGLIAYPFASIRPVAQVAELTGTWGLSFLGALFNSAIAELLAARWNLARPAAPNVARLVATPVLLFAAFGLFGLMRLPSIQPSHSLNVLLVQQNVDAWQPGQFEAALARAQQLTRSGLQNSGPSDPDMVVWSETALRRPYSPNSTFYRERPAVDPFRAFLDEMDRPLITGMPAAVPQSGDFWNAAAVIDPSGERSGLYAKQQLVPFAELLPFFNVPSVRSFYERAVGLAGTWAPGDGPRTFSVALRDGSTVRVGLPICFEDAFGWVTRELVIDGADLLVNLTNNSWSRQVSAQTQHYVAARLRTIELRTTLVRGTNSGLSGVVDATGRLVDSLPMFVGVAQTIEAPIYPPRTTLYRVVGDAFGVLFAGLGIALTIAKTARDWRARRTRRLRATL